MTNEGSCDITQNDNIGVPGYRCNECQQWVSLGSYHIVHQPDKPLTLPDGNELKEIKVLLERLVIAIEKITELEGE
jgi:hypothetical protein